VSLLRSLKDNGPTYPATVGVLVHNMPGRYGIGRRWVGLFG